MHNQKHAKDEQSHKRSKMSSRYILKTLGCKANLYDSQIIEAELQKKGWLPQSKLQSDQVQLCIVNSCTVTNEADKQSRKLAQRLAKENPQAIVVVTGCGAEIDPEGIARTPGVHFVSGNQDKNKLIQNLLNATGVKQIGNKNQDDQFNFKSSFLTSDIQKTKILGSVKEYKEINSKHPMDREWTNSEEAFSTVHFKPNTPSNRTRAFLKIQEGCNSFCTYCIIPYGRGPSRSLKPKSILQQTKNLIEAGVQEIIITGTNIGDYGTDWNSSPMLGDLLEMILQNTSIKRLRVSSLDPTEITPQICLLMQKYKAFCPHFHVSVQSPSSRILKLMKRKYRFEDVKFCLEKISNLKGPNESVYIGMDIITGFPGETDEEFEWSYETLKHLPWTRLHVFPYSERDRTPATRLPHSVPQFTRVQRARMLNQLSLGRLQTFYRLILDQTLKSESYLPSVLTEKAGNNSWIAGYTPNYLRVLISREELLEPNQLLSVVPYDIIVDSNANEVALLAKPLPHLAIL